MDNILTGALVEPLTVVIPTHNQAETLRCHLPAILNQDYEEFEVIVVDIASTDDTNALLEGMEQCYHRLRHTATPSSARDISLERLAITLGIRSSQYEWVVLTQADAAPVSNQWLTRLASAIRRTPGAELLVGHVRYEEQSVNWFDRKMSFFRLWHSVANFEHIQSGHAAVRASGCNMAVRKSVFLASGGFSDSQSLSVGACELLANHMSTKENTAVCAEAEAVVVQDRPTMHRWYRERVEYMEIRRHQRHVWLYRIHNNLRLFWPWCALLLIMLPFFGGCALLGMSIAHENAQYLHPFTKGMYAPVPPTNEELLIYCGLLSLVLLSLVIVTTVHIRQFNRKATILGHDTFYLTLLPLECMMPFWTVSAWLGHRFSSKNEFRKKFI